jgi:two-component system sensor histidine kinase/response regulator
LPVIFLSAESEREQILKGFEIGGQDYITKPYDGRELIVRVKTHIALKFSLEKLEALNRLLEEKVYERTYQLREANEKLERTNVKLINLDKAKTEFLNLISHEIRTPLNGIIGPINLLKDSFFEHEMADLVDILDMSVKRLEKFALNALLVTRLRTNSKISKSQIQLVKILIDVLNEFEDKIGLKNIQIKKSFYPDHISVYSEYNFIKICLVNIIDNAVKFSPDEGLIEIRCFIEEKYIIIEVQDHGAGFSKVILDNAFELFVVSDTLADNQTGMGLHIVKMIMDGHGGNAKLFNDPSGGAVVRLEFIKYGE